MIDVMRSAIKVTAVCAASVLAVATSACDPAAIIQDGGDDGGNNGGELSVVTGVYPFEWLATKVGGEHVDVTNLTEPGVDPHDLELSPRQTGQVTEADLAFYVSGLQPAIDDAIDQEGDENALDVADLIDLLPADSGEGDGHDHDHDHGDDEHDHGTADPHMWLDTDRMSRAAEGLAERLAEADPGNAEEYRANAAQTTEALSGIDDDYATTLQECESRDIVVNHAAFGYLAESYDLNQISVNTADSGSEPAPGRIAEVADLVEEHDITTVFTETLAPPDAAETIASETGAETAVLDPAEGLTDESPGDNYPAVMDANLETLSSALRCS